ncbi:MAG: hypothetical protein JXA30_02420 [Deltaproteobacteria bacterium]|nr:hypothetical protein [Deltaproteobacteria bacterium]
MSETEQNQTTTNKEFVSTLHRGRERFLAHVIEKGFEIGSRTASDFIRHFSPATIMLGLEKRPALRAKILVATTGVREKIAAKKSAKSCGEDLQIALDERETDADTIVANLDPDDRIRYLDAAELWSYITEPRFWEVSGNDEASFERSKFFVAFLLDRALTDELVTHGDIIDGLTVKTLAEMLPRNELETVIASSLRYGRSAKPFTDADFFREIPSLTLVEHIPLSLIWNQVIAPLVADAHGFTKHEDAEKTDERLVTQTQPPKEENPELKSAAASDAEKTGRTDEHEETPQPRLLEKRKEADEGASFAARLERKRFRGLTGGARFETKQEETPLPPPNVTRRESYSEETTTVAPFKTDESASAENDEAEIESALDNLAGETKARGEEARSAPTSPEPPSVRRITVPKAAPPPLPFKR